MVEVFKTNVKKKKVAQEILTTLKEEFPRFKINFDLEDCDKILRVEGKKISPTQIIQRLESKNYSCIVLE
jgi:hypothetical protein